MHAEATEIAKRRGLIRPKKTQRGMAAALLQAPPGQTKDSLLAAPPGMEGTGPGSSKLDSKNSGDEGALTLVQKLASEGSHGQAIAMHMQSIGADGGALVTKEAFEKAMHVSGKISKGAIANVGGLVVRAAAREYQQKKNPELSPQDVVWMLTQQYQEKNASKKKPEPFPTDVDSEMLEWFQSKGGIISKLGYPTPDDLAAEAEEKGGDDSFLSMGGGSKRRPLRQLVASEDIDGSTDGPGQVVLQVPMRLTMSQLTARTVKMPGGRGYLGDRRHLKDAFKHNQAWALAHMLLYEMYKDGSGDGGSSKWAPYINTLRLRSLTQVRMHACRRGLEN
jgi:hypothetical protein